MTFLSAFLAVKMFTYGEPIQSALQRRFGDWHISIEPITSLLDEQIVSTREIFGRILGKIRLSLIEAAGVLIREAGQIFARPAGEPETA